jgi:hypothetical protein
MRSTQGRFPSQAGSSSSAILLTRAELASYAIAQFRPLAQLVASSTADTDAFLAHIMKWPRLKALRGAFSRVRVLRALSPWTSRSNCLFPALVCVAPTAQTPHARAEGDVTAAKKRKNGKAPVVVLDDDDDDKDQVDSQELAAAARADEEVDEDETHPSALPPATQLHSSAPAGATSQPSTAEHLFTGPDADAHRAELACRGLGRGRGGGRERGVATSVVLNPPQKAQAGRQRQKRHKGVHAR